jgi:hypothetical protein
MQGCHDDKGNMRQLVGLEHEYRLANDESVDFRTLIHNLGLANPRLDTSDLNAYRLSCGALLTRDGREAELALPPTSQEAGFTCLVEARQRTALAQLKQFLPAEMHTQGYSTHISVSMDPKYGERLALLFARTFAPALMLLMDKRDSPGLLIRPRPKRIEFGGEYVAGLRLRAALAMAVGSVRACLSEKHSPMLALRLMLDDHRYGWYVDRHAFGPDLYREGRRTRLRLADGGSITAQEQLEASWSIAREALSEFASDADLLSADQMVTGSLPLPIEDPIDPQDEEAIDEHAGQNIYGKVLEPRARPGFDLAPVLVTWDVCVFVVVDQDRSRRAFACVPGDDLERFILQLDSGELDRQIGDYLDRPASRRKLGRFRQTSKFGLYDALGPRRKLIAPELDPEAKRWRRLLVARQVAALLKRTDHENVRQRAVSLIERILGYG